MSDDAIVERENVSGRAIAILGLSCGSSWTIRFGNLRQPRRLRRATDRPTLLSDIRPRIQQTAGQKCAALTFHPRCFAIPPMPSADVEALLREVSPDAPAGPDLSYDPAYQELEHVARGT